MEKKEDKDLEEQEEHEVIYELFNQISFLNELPSKTKGLLAKRLQLVHYFPYEKVQEQGDVPKYFYLIYIG